MLRRARVYPSITPERFAAIAQAVTTKVGFPINGTSGQATQKGVCIAWLYDPVAQTLTLTLVQRSFWDPSEASIYADLDALVAQTGGA